MKLITFLALLLHFLQSHCMIFSPEYLDLIKTNFSVDGFDFQQGKYHPEYPYYKGPIKDVEEYDFIIVGAGSAGSLLANRLSQEKSWKILLLEAGRPEIPLTDIPIMSVHLTQTDYNWNYLMEKQDNMCLAMKDQKCPWPRGRALGGTSVINYMIYTRGSKADFDNWAANGNPGWAWDDVLPYYLKFERTQAKLLDKNYHGTNGTLYVTDLRTRTPSGRAFLETAKEFGYDIIDYNGRKQLGFGPLQATIEHGRRCSATKAFIRPIQTQTNIRILPASRVTKILINPQTKTAYGVKYFRNNRTYKALAKKEVILSAGPIASPQLLMISGVGPKNQLEPLKIPVIKDLPVGETLQDHIAFLGLTFIMNQTAGGTLEGVLKKDYFEYIYNKTGILTIPGGVEGLGYIQTKNKVHLNDQRPDIELIFLYSSYLFDRGASFRETVRMRKDFYQSVYGDVNTTNSFTLAPMLLYPKSKGSIKLKSANIYKDPLLYGNYFTDPEGEDMETMLEGIKEAIRLSKSEAFRRFGSEVLSVPYPNCKHLPFGSDDYWRCAIRTMTTTLHHQVATCKMGPKSDPTAIVDHQLRVYGIDRLRVVDTSIIPSPLSAHTNAPAFLIGEKASHLIKEFWHSRT